MENNSDDTIIDLTQPLPPNSARDFTGIRRSRFSFAGFASMLNEDESPSEFPPPPDYTPAPFALSETVSYSSPRTSSTLPRAVSSRACSSRTSRYSRSSQRLRPTRCKSGNASVGIGECTDVDNVKTWKTRFVDIRENVMYIASGKESNENRVTISLKKKYVSMPRKKIVAIHGGPKTLLIRSTSEIDAYHWMMALSQYCYVAPMMDGFCEKLCRGKNEFKDRYLRLCSDGVLSWYRSESEDAEPRGSIQVRGEESWIDNANPKIIHIQVEPKGYQFRFYSKREAELWQAALQWHYGRKLLRKASVPIRNKATKQDK